MALRELYPYITVKHAEFVEKRNQKPQNSQSYTVRLLREDWNTQQSDWIDTGGKYIKERGIGDKLAEEGTELGGVKTSGEVLDESSQALYTMIVGWVKLGIKPGVVFILTNNLLKQQIVLPEKEGKLPEHAGTAISRINGPGASKNKLQVIKRSAEALIALHALWESKGISPSDVGEKI